LGCRELGRWGPCHLGLRQLGTTLLTAALLAPIASGRLASAQVTTLTTADGSRFVLCVDPTEPQVHWAIASWLDGLDDPPSHPGLARVVLHLARLGTFRTGSLDPTAERNALAALDAARAAVQQNATDTGALARLAALEQQAAALGDPAGYERVLAALPAHRPEVGSIGPCGVFTLTTLADALPAVAAMLVERREDVALRGLAAAWAEVPAARRSAAADPFAPLATELLALTWPNHPLARRSEAASTIAPRHAEALAVWAATQHPSRTVHVLVGDFDTEATAAVLRAAFQRSLLPAPIAAQAPSPHPLQGHRRSQVPGIVEQASLLAFPLPANPDAAALQVVSQWLGDAEGPLAQELRRERANVQVAVQAPWPLRPASQGMLLLEVLDRGGRPGLADALRAACTKVAQGPRDQQALAALLEQGQRLRLDLGAEPRQLASVLAARELQAPGSTTEPAPTAEAVQRLTSDLLRGPSALVEGVR